MPGRLLCFCYEQVVGKLLIEILDGIPVDVMVYGADKDGPHGADQHQHAEHAKDEYCDPYKRVNSPSQQGSHRRQHDKGEQLDQPEAEACPKAFAPFFLHHSGRTFKSGDRSQILIGDDRDDKKGGDTPYDPDQAGDELADRTQVILQEAKRGANRRGEGRPGQEHADAAKGELQTLPDRGFFAVEIEVRTMDQRRIEEYDDKIVHQVVYEYDCIMHGRGLILDIPETFEVPAHRSKCDQEKRSDHQDKGNTRKDGEEDQLTILL